MKTFKRVLKTITGIVFFLIVSILLLLSLDNEKQDSSIVNPPPKIVPVKFFSKSRDSLRYDELLSDFGKNKKLPKNFEIQALVALSHYPQLKNIKIEFRLTDSRGSLYSQMDIKSLLTPWESRVYVILIDTVKVVEYTKPTLLANLPYNAQIGVLGHELAHTISYLDKGGLSLAWIALRYQTSRKYVIPFENDTERRTIKFGIGNQLLTWSEFQHDIKIKEGKGEFYFSPKQIKEEMRKYSFYDVPK